MSDAPPPDPREDLLEKAITSFWEAVERGHPPDPAEYLARYPDCAAELAPVLEQHRLLDAVFAPFRPSATREAVRVALPTDSGAPATEVQEPLRKRLRTMALILVLGITLMRGVGLAFDYPKLLDDPLTAFTQPPYYGASALVVCLEVAAVLLLSPRRRATLPRLRAMEWLVYAPLVASATWNERLDLARLAPVFGEQSGLTIAYAKSLPWVIFMVGYGVLVPNNWRRCAAAIGLFALLGLLPDLFALLGSGVPAGALAVYLANKMFWIGIAAAIVIYGARRLELLVHEAGVARRLGQYRLGRRLGIGGMGEVYLAEHDLLRRPCAIKLIRPERAGDLKNLLRFKREVHETAKLTHANIVQVYDYGLTESGTFYYVMEYLPGLTLEELVEQHGPLPPERAIHLLRQVCGALGEAHALGLIHRDVKPRNILVCARGGVHDVAKLLDFGLVRSQGSGPGEADLTGQHAIAGTPHYMSPEQAAGEDVDCRADLYSLGAVAYFLLTGQPPFAGRLVGQVLAAHQYEAPASLTMHRPELPAELEAVVLRCLAKKPADRFPDAPALAKALAACPITAPWGDEEAAAWWRSRPGAAGSGDTESEPTVSQTSPPS